MHTLDKIDRAILKVLQADCRVSMAELGQRVSLSASACHRRIKIMEEAGIIRGYGARLDADAMGQAMAFVLEVSLNSQSDEAMRAFETKLALIPEVLEANLMTGPSDYVLRVAAKDTVAFEQVHARVREAPHVQRIETKMVLRHVKPWSGMRV